MAACTTTTRPIKSWSSREHLGAACRLTFARSPLRSFEPGFLISGARLHFRVRKGGVCDRKRIFDRNAVTVRDSSMKATFGHKQNFWRKSFSAENYHFQPLLDGIWQDIGHFTADPCYQMVIFFLSSDQNTGKYSQKMFRP